MVDQQEDKYKDVNKGKGEDIEICRYKKKFSYRFATKKVSYTLTMTLTTKTKALIAI